MATSYTAARLAELTKQRNDLNAAIEAEILKCLTEGVKQVEVAKASELTRESIRRKALASRAREA